MVVEPMTISDVGQIYDGPHATPERRSEGPYFLNISRLNNGRLDLSQSDHVSGEDFATWTKRVEPQEGDLLFSYETRLGEAALMPAGVKACLGRRMALLRPNRSRAHPRYLLYYYLGPEFQRLIEQKTIHGATVNRIPIASMGSWPLRLPPLDAQRAIAEVLGALDDKIAANERVVNLLLNFMECSYEAAVRRGSTRSKLEDVAEFHNRRRVPLSAREREGRPGRVPYYGATGVFGHVDEALFDEVLLLVGEDGSVITESGGPVVQYIWGPAWVNNHAHVLTGKGIPTELLRFAVSRADVRHLVTGAVQPKIAMGKLRTLRLDLPIEEQRVALRNMLREHSAALRARSDEIHVLSELRDALLPQLMSGKIRVKDAENVVSEAV